MSIIFVRTSLTTNSAATLTKSQDGFGALDLRDVGGVVVFTHPPTSRLCCSLAIAMERKTSCVASHIHSSGGVDE